MTVVYPGSEFPRTYQSGAPSGLWRFHPADPAAPPSAFSVVVAVGALVPGPSTAVVPFVAPASAVPASVLASAAAAAKAEATAVKEATAEAEAGAASPMSAPPASTATKIAGASLAATAGWETMASAKAEAALPLHTVVDWATRASTAYYAPVLRRDIGVGAAQEALVGALAACFLPAAPLPGVPTGFDKITGVAYSSIIELGFVGPQLRMAVALLQVRVCTCG
jgi:hypothetical protein